MIAARLRAGLEAGTVHRISPEGVPVRYQPLIEVVRGGRAESLHFGAIAVADVRGHLRAWYGDPQAITFLRSTAKPFQALPLLESGAADGFSIDDRALALICASHSGTLDHVRLVEALQAQVGIEEADLRCGAHPPLDADAARRLREAGEQPRPNHNNCSGKHTGMLALARHLGAPLEGYLSIDHPVQQRILAAMGEMCDAEPSQIAIGIDGCSAPTFALPLVSAATGYARLADPALLPPTRSAACRRIFSAMTRHPDMVGGPGRFDTVLMQAAQGSLLSKGGADGYHGLAIAPGVLASGSPALGIALKIADGDLGQRAGARVAIEVLRQLGAIDETALAALEAQWPKAMTNWRGLQVGEIRPCFRLEMG